MASSWPSYRSYGSRGGRSSSVRLVQVSSGPCEDLRLRSSLGRMRRAKGLLPPFTLPTCPKLRRYRLDDEESSLDEEGGCSLRPPAASRGACAPWSRRARPPPYHAPNASPSPPPISHPCAEEYEDSDEETEDEEDEDDIEYQVRAVVWAMSVSAGLTAACRRVHVCGWKGVGAWVGGGGTAAGDAHEVPGAQAHMRRSGSRSREWLWRRSGGHGSLAPLATPAPPAPGSAPAPGTGLPASQLSPPSPDHPPLPGVGRGG